VFDGVAAAFGVFEPAQGQALGAAHVGAIRVDAAAPRGVEKGAGTFCVGLGGLQQGAVAIADILRLDLENAQVIAATTAATPAALKTAGVSAFESRCALVDLGMEFAECL
jgi:hypothetical protein